MTTNEAQANLNTISGIMTVFGSLARVLFYSGSSKSFVNTLFALHADRELSPLKHKLVVMTSLEEQIIRTYVFRGCEVLIEGVVLKANLIPLEIWDFDVRVCTSYPLIERQWIVLRRRLYSINQDFQSWNLKMIVEFYLCA